MCLKEKTQKKVFPVHQNFHTGMYLDGPYAAGRSLESNGMREYSFQGSLWWDKNKSQLLIPSSSFGAEFLTSAIQSH